MSVFQYKWRGIKEGKGTPADERTLFVDIGQTPITQRQLNLYYYFLFIKDIIERVGAREVLEAGCGRGTMALYLSKYLGYRMTLVDNVPEAIEIAKQEFSRYHQSAEFFVEDVRQTHFAPSSFDAIVSIGLAEHFPPAEVKKLFAEEYRLLRPGGVMISLNIPKKFSIQWLNTVMRFFKKLVGSYREELYRDYFRNSLTAREYQRLAKQVGFTQVSTTHVCPFPIYVPVTMATDKQITKINKLILAFRRLFQFYPYKTNALLAQAHFLVGYK